MREQQGSLYICAFAAVVRAQPIVYVSNCIWAERKPLSHQHVDVLQDHHLVQLVCDAGRTAGALACAVGVGNAVTAAGAQRS